MKLNQFGIVYLIPLLLLLGGLIAGLYLVQQTQILKPRASETNFNKETYEQIAKAENIGSMILETKYDNSPPQIIYNSFDKFDPMKKVASISDLNYEVSKSPDEIQIKITQTETPKSNQEKEDDAKSILNNLLIDKDKGYYELKILGYMLANEPSEYFNFNIPFTQVNIQANPQGTPQINPWYALCPHLPEDVLHELGFTKTILWGKGATIQDPVYLICSDPPPTEQDLGVFPYSGKPSVANKYKFYQPPATILVNFLEAGIAAREQIDQSAFGTSARFVARYMIPIIGPQIAALVEPGIDPKEVVHESNFSTGAFVLFMGLGPAVQGVGRGASTAIEATGLARTVQVILNSEGKVLGKFLFGAEEAVGQAAENSLFALFRSALKNKGTETTMHVVAAPPESGH